MTKSNNKFSLKINLLNVNYAISVFVMIVICFPLNTQAYPALAGILRMAVFPCALWAAIILIREKVYQKKWLIPMWCFFAIMLLCTALMNTSVVQGSLITVLRMFTVTVLTDYMMSKDKYLTLRWIACIWGVLMILEVLSMIFHFFPGHVSENNIPLNNYLFGIRVEINQYLIYIIAFLGFAYFVNQIGRILPILVILGGVYFVIAEKVSTSITGLLAFVAVYVATKVVKSARAWRILIILLIAFIIVFVIDRNTLIFESFFVGFLNKDLTLSGRTILWEQALSQMKGIHWLFGYGYTPPAALHLNVAVFNHPHNQYLQMLYNFGIPGFITYMVILFNQIKQIRLIKKNKQIKSVYIASLIATLVICISSRNFFYLTAQIYYVIAYYLPELDEYRPRLRVRWKVRSKA